MIPTSGKLAYSDVKGLHHVDAVWWIFTGIEGHAFRLDAYDGGKPTSMDNYGHMHVMPGYLWDGSSGPTVDGKPDPIPSLVHDVLYEAMRARKLPLSMRQTADELYYRLLRERGMGALRAGARYYGLRLFGAFAASPGRGPEYPKRKAA